MTVFPSVVPIQNAIHRVAHCNLTDVAIQNVQPKSGLLMTVFPSVVPIQNVIPQGCPLQPYGCFNPNCAAQIGIANDSVPLGDSQSECDSTGMVSVHWPGIPLQFNWKRAPSVSEIDTDAQNNQFSWQPDYQTMKPVLGLRKPSLDPHKV